MYIDVDLIKFAAVRVKDKNNIRLHRLVAHSVRYGVASPTSCGTLNANSIRRSCDSRVSETTRSVANLLLELLFIEQGSFYSCLTPVEVAELIRFCCTS